ncbi:MAG: ABC transporter substrate-binding protein [Proteobacteria bacterium]|nr:ABC transporter substrate-binding protein [Pseudomonadota bacterium]
MLGLPLGLPTAGMPLAAFAQPRAKRIGVLSGGVKPASLESSVHGAFLLGMRELHYVEGRDFVVEWRYAEGNYERLADFVAEFVRMPVDVIVAFSTRGAVEAMQATKTIPIVFAGVSDPLGSGLVKSLAHPGGNVTGASEGHDASVLKHLDLLHSMVPALSSVGVLFNPNNPFYLSLLERLQSVGPGLGIEIAPVAVHNAGEIETSFAALKSMRAQAVVVFDDSMFFVQRHQLADAAYRVRLPAIAGNREYAEAGLLFSYGELLSEHFRRGAAYVDKIFRGAKPGDLPVEQPTRFFFVINRKTAKALELTIPTPLLLRADEVVE